MTAGIIWTVIIAAVLTYIVWSVLSRRQDKATLERQQQVIVDLGKKAFPDQHTRSMFEPEHQVFRDVERAQGFETPDQMKRRVAPNGFAEHFTAVMGIGVERSVNWPIEPWQSSRPYGPINSTGSLKNAAERGEIELETPAPTEEQLAEHRRVQDEREAKRLRASESARARLRESGDQLRDLVLPTGPTAPSGISPAPVSRPYTSAPMSQDPEPKKTCWRCGGRGKTQATRVVPDVTMGIVMGNALDMGYFPSMKTETYDETCTTCGGSGKTR